MSAKNDTHIARLQDGSIDYQYYAEKGLIEKNKELKLVVDKFFDTSRLKTRFYPAFLTVILVIMVF